MNPQTLVVFAPTPILTVTLEAGAEGEDDLHVHAGGQGVWISRMLVRLGLRPLISAPFGGETGAVLRNLLELEGIAVGGVTVRRANGYYVHDRRRGHRLVVASRYGEQLDRHDTDDLYGATLVAGLEAGILVLGGQLSPGVVPMDMYQRLARDLRANGCRVIGDLRGEALAAALEGGLDILKISHEEATADGWVRGGELNDLLSGVERMQAAGAKTVVVSRAGAPALAAADGHLWEIVTPLIEPADFRGTGDSMTAGLAAGLAGGLPLPDTLRLGAAAGCLNATRHGLGTGARDEIERLSRHVELRLVDVSGRPERADGP